MDTKLALIVFKSRNHFSDFIFILFDSSSEILCLFIMCVVRIDLISFNSSCKFLSSISRSLILSFNVLIFFNVIMYFNRSIN